MLLFHREVCLVYCRHHSGGSHVVEPSRLSAVHRLCAASPTFYKCSATVPLAFLQVSAAVEALAGQVKGLGKKARAKKVSSLAAPPPPPGRVPLQQLQLFLKELYH